MDGIIVKLTRVISGDSQEKLKILYKMILSRIDLVRESNNEYALISEIGGLINNVQEI